MSRPPQRALSPTHRADAVPPLSTPSLATPSLATPSLANPSLANPSLANPSLATLSPAQDQAEVLTSPGAPIFVRTNLKKTAKARLTVPFLARAIGTLKPDHSTPRPQGLNPSARRVVDRVAIRGRGDRRHSDQNRVLTSNEPGRNALGERVDRRLVLEGLAKCGLVEKIDHPRQYAARERQAAGRHEGHRHVAGKARYDMPIKPETRRLFAIGVGQRRRCEGTR